MSQTTDAAEFRHRLERLEKYSHKPFDFSDLVRRLEALEHALAGSAPVAMDTHICGSDDSGRINRLREMLGMSDEESSDAILWRVKELLGLLAAREARDEDVYLLSRSVRRPVFVEPGPIHQAARRVEEFLDTLGKAKKAP